MVIKNKAQVTESLRPYRFEHTWNVPYGETETAPYYNNFYMGNGHMDMYVDAVGSQSFPFTMAEKRNYVYVDGTDQSAGEPHSAVLNMAPLYYHTNTHPVISTNDNWAKQAYNEFNNTHGRGPFALRISFLPAVNGVLDIARISKHRQTLELFDNICRTEFLYDDALQVSVESFVSWKENRLAVFHMTVRNVSSEIQDSSVHMEPIVVWHGKRRAFSLSEFSDTWTFLSNDRDLLFPTVVMATMQADGTVCCSERESVLRKALRPQEEISATVYAVMLNRDTSEDYEEAARSILHRARADGYENVRERHTAEVLRFWSDWEVKFPDRALDCTYHRNALIIAGNLRGGKYYPSVSTVAGSSYAGVGWGMDNVVLYDFMMQIHKAPYVRNVYRYLKECIPDWGFEEGSQFDYAFDHNPISEKVMAGTSPNYAWLMYAYYRYTGDEAFLRETAFPVMRAVCNFTAGFAKEKEGKYGLWNKTIYQGHMWRVHSYDEFIHRVTRYDYADGDNVIDIIAPTRAVLKEAIVLGKRFGVREEERRCWQDCLERLPVPQNDEYYLTFEGTDYKDDYPMRDIMSVATASLIYPAEAPDLKHEKLEKTLRVLFELEKYGGTFFHVHNYNLLLWPTVARMRMTSFLHWLMTESPLSYEKAVYNRAKDGMMLNETQGGGAGYFLMSYGNMNAAVNHMLLSSFDGTIRVFPALGNDYGDREACFAGLAAFGGYTVASRMCRGLVDGIEIHSAYDGICRVELPRGWSGSVIFSGSEKIAFSVEEETVRIDEKSESVSIVIFECRPDREYRICPV